MKEILTVFTPTYNRAYILPKLYQSLKLQTNQQFQWLIVDDGSSDGTRELVNNWIGEKQLKIKYFYQTNGGKMKAHNRGVEEADTELFVCVDSDDWLVENSVENILKEWKILSNNSLKKICGMVAYRGKNACEVIGSHFPAGISRDTLSGIYEKGFSGDTTLIFRTEILRQYPFPIIGKEKFITEAYIYDQIDKKFEFHIMPKILIVCEYREDGLTLNLLKISFKNPGGYVAYFIQKGNFSSSKLECLLAYVRANAFRGLVKNLELPVEPQYKILYKLARPMGWVLWLIKKIKYNKLQKNKD